MPYSACSVYQPSKTSVDEQMRRMTLSARNRRSSSSSSSIAWRQSYVITWTRTHYVVAADEIAACVLIASHAVKLTARRLHAIVVVVDVSIQLHFLCAFAPYAVSAIATDERRPGSTCWNKWLSYHRQTALQGGLVMTGIGRQYFTDIYLQPLWRYWPAKQSNSVKKNAK